MRSLGNNIREFVQSASETQIISLRDLAIPFQPLTNDEIQSNIATESETVRLFPRPDNRISAVTFIVRAFCEFLSTANNYSRNSFGFRTVLKRISGKIVLLFLHNRTFVKRFSYIIRVFSNGFGQSTVLVFFRVRI